jgi:hypothetical protein
MRRHQRSSCVHLSRQCAYASPTRRDIPYLAAGFRLGYDVCAPVRDAGPGAHRGMVSAMARRGSGHGCLVASGILVPGYGGPLSQRCDRRPQAPSAKCAACGVRSRTAPSLGGWVSVPRISRWSRALPTLEPSLPWAEWDHDQKGTWPDPDDIEADAEARLEGLTFDEWLETEDAARLMQ